MLAFALLVIVGATVVFYLFTKKHTNTATASADFTLSAVPFIQEFVKNEKLANPKYAEKIITVNGRVAETEPSDSSINVKMIDTSSGAYIIFAFQPQDAANAKGIMAGDSVSIKGSCSGGTYSEILDVHFISFKRSTLDQNFK